MIRSLTWKCGLLFCLTLVFNVCISIDVSFQETAPWIVSIQKYSLLNDSKNVEHCVGVLTKPNHVVTSRQCWDTFPDNSKMILFAGLTAIDQSFYGTVQRFLRIDATIWEYSKMILMGITPSIERTRYVDVIEICNGLQTDCLFDTIGFQYGFRSSSTYKRMYMSQYDFSNSSALCSELNEYVDYKFCTYHVCKINERNIGGEPLTKIYKGQSFLMGFWDYDACDKNIRVFHKVGF